MKDAPDRWLARTLLVTGHPNHELAILGFVQRARPHLLFLTDGGGPERVNESRDMLRELKLLERARFLDVTEADLYRALLEADRSLLSQLVAETRRVIEAVEPRQVLCESVEFYNPLHDLTLPVVQAAARRSAGVEVLEYPLIAEIPGSGGRFRVQRPPASRENEARSIRLTGSELEIKLRAGGQRYPSLRRQMGSLLDLVSREEAAEEVFLPARFELPVPGREHVLRYEERGRTLQAAGTVETTITFADHFVPMVASLRRL